MSRQEATNVFNDGLVSDLNPLTTPDSVLTDCINGSILTYNGNEFVLQNDQGNYKLKNAKLKPNFIPVGVREYADILYIVSYNPLSKEMEVGSYPYPRTIFSTENNIVKDLTPLIENNSPAVDDTYENITKKSVLVIYNSSTESIEEFKLNPGDQFRISGLSGDELDFAYQGLQFYVLSDDKKLFEIEIPDEYLNDPDLHPVLWETPGWLAARYRLANIDSFNVNIKSVSTQEFILDDEDLQIDVNLNFQLELSDPLFINNPNTINDLKIDIKIYNNDVDPGKLLISQIIPENGLELIQYNPLSTIYFTNSIFNIKSTDFLEIDKKITIDDTLIIVATPILNSRIDTITYDQFATTLSFNLSETSSASSISIADTLYKYYVNDNNTITLEFNVNGPFLNNSAVELRYQIFKVIPDSGNNLISVRDEVVIPGFNLFGQNIVLLNFDNSFLPEDIYFLVFSFYQGDKVIKKTVKIFIPSKTFNEYYSSMSTFDNLYADDWLSKFVNYCSFDNNSLAYVDDIGESGTTDVTGSYPVGDKGYFSASTIRDVTYNIGENVTYRYTLNSVFRQLSGALWDNLTRSMLLNIVYNTNNRKEIILSTSAYTNGRVNISTNIDITYRFYLELIARMINQGPKDWPDYTPTYLSKYLSTAPSIVSGPNIYAEVEYDWTGDPAWNVDQKVYTYNSDSGMLARNTDRGMIADINGIIVSGTAPLPLVATENTSISTGTGADLRTGISRLLSSEECFVAIVKVLNVDWNSSEVSNTAFGTDYGIWNYEKVPFFYLAFRNTQNYGGFGSFVVRSFGNEVWLKDNDSNVTWQNLINSIIQAGKHIFTIKMSDWRGMKSGFWFRPQQQEGNTVDTINYNEAYLSSSITNHGCDSMVTGCHEPECWFHNLSINPIILWYF